MAAELDSQLGSIERRLAELEEERLFSGDHDAGDAVVTVRAGAGGTDSQDWAEMLLRMYLRWAERPRLQGRDEGGLGGRGGRDQVGHLPRPRRERLRAVRGRARRAPAGPDLALRLAVAPPHRLRPARRRAAGLRRGRGRARRGRHPRRHLPGLGRRRPARQQDRLGGAPHPRADRDRRPVPERALADPEQGDRDADAARPAARRGGAQAGRGGGRPSAASRSRPSGAARSAATRCTPRPGSRITAPTTRSATPSACSTAISTSSSAATCCRRRRARADRAAGAVRGRRSRRSTVVAWPSGSPSDSPTCRTRSTPSPRRPRWRARACRARPTSAWPSSAPITSASSRRR